MARNRHNNTVVRGGFGIFSDLYQGLIADRLITNAPAVASFTTNPKLNPNAIVATNGPNAAPTVLLNSYNAFIKGFASGATLTQLQAAVPGFSKPNFNTVA